MTPVTLTVTQPFGTFARGAQITDTAEVAAILGSPNAVHVVKVATVPPLVLDVQIAGRLPAIETTQEG